MSSLRVLDDTLVVVLCPQLDLVYDVGILIADMIVFVLLSEQLSSPRL